MKLVNGAGAYLYFKDRSDLKFSQKQFKEKLMENEEFRKVFMEASLEVLEALIYDPGEEEDMIDSFDITGGILDMIKIA
jgi:hypothetical protein